MREILNAFKKHKICVFIASFLVFIIFICGAVLFHYTKPNRENGGNKQQAERTYTDAINTNRDLKSTTDELSSLIEEVRKQKSN